MAKQRSLHLVIFEHARFTWKKTKNNRYYKMSITGKLWKYRILFQEYKIEFSMQISKNKDKPLRAVEVKNIWVESLWAGPNIRVVLRKQCYMFLSGLLRTQYIRSSSGFVCGRFANMSRGKVDGKYLGAKLQIIQIIKLYKINYTL